MRLAGSEELYSTLKEQDKAKRLKDFFTAYERLQSSGLSDEHAQHYAIEMAEGREPMVKLSLRFAGIYGDSDEDNQISREDDRGI